MDNFVFLFILIFCFHAQLNFFSPTLLGLFGFIYTGTTISAEKLQTMICLTLNKVKVSSLGFFFKVFTTGLKFVESILHNCHHCITILERRRQNEWANCHLLTLHHWIHRKPCAYTDKLLLSNHKTSEKRPTSNFFKERSHWR